MYFILQGIKPVQVSSMMEWAIWFETANRQVRFTRVGIVEISTVFVGIDFGYKIFHRKPMIFETLIFGGQFAYSGRKYSNYADALAGHQKLVDDVLNSTDVKLPI